MAPSAANPKLAIRSFIFRPPQTFVAQVSPGPGGGSVRRRRGLGGTSLSHLLIGRQKDSCLIQAELDAGGGFSYKMSLKARGTGMLGIDHQHGRFGSGERGADPGVF